MVASNPPAEPPMPTIGQLKFFFSGLPRAVCSVDLERADFLRLDFFRDRDVALFGDRGGALFGIRFAAMALFRLIAAHRLYKLVIAVLPRGIAFSENDE